EREVPRQDGLLARKVIEQVAGRHAGGTRHVRKAGGGVALLDHAVVQGLEDARTASGARGRASRGVCTRHGSGIRQLSSRAAHSARSQSLLHSPPSITNVAPVTKFDL